MKRKNFEFPTAYTVLFLILILVTVLTHIIPAGKYDRLSYQQDTKEFVIEKYGNENITLEATQENLDKGDTFVVKDLFKGYEWNKIDRADRLRLGVLFLSWAQGDGKKIIKIEEKTHSGQQAYIKL